MILPLGEESPCPACVHRRGLCGRHARAILPQLARNIGWLKLIADATVEQTRLQNERANAVAIEKAKRRSARRIARSQRRGYYGLALAITARKAG